MCSVLPVKYVGMPFAYVNMGLSSRKIYITTKLPDFPWQKWLDLKEEIKGIKEKVLDYFLVSSVNLYAFQTFQQ